jgi:protein phosphatase
MSVRIECFGQTDRGRVRDRNEDQFLVADLDKAMRISQTSLSDHDRRHLSGVNHGKLLLVADGMGGHSGGELASGLAVETVARYALETMPWFFQVQDGREAELEGELRESLERCQRTVEAAANHSGHGRMGTTLTMAYVLWPRLYVVHAGDSRCYLARGGKVEQITHDHTVAQRLVDQGVLSPEEAGESRWSHALWKCIGGKPGELNPDVYKARLKPGDVILLCSDGLSKYVTEEAIAAELSRGLSAEETASHLVSAANAAGGSDNITVVLARCHALADTVEVPALQGTAFLPKI